MASAENKLTNKTIWENYWKNFAASTLPSKSFYHNYLPHKSKDSRFIEIGGFPGLNAAYFYKHVCNHVTILDFYINKKIINQIEIKNNIPVNTIQAIESDFFEFKPKQTYDIVFSLGFIEHFNNTQDIIKRHIDILSQNGSLLIILPNLKGINGMVQYLMDKQNLKIHNLKNMDIQLLKNILIQSGLKDIQVEYTRKPMVWLEPKPGFINKIKSICVKGVSYFIKLFPFRCKLLSPYIILSATK